MCAQLYTMGEPECVQGQVGWRKAHPKHCYCDATLVAHSCVKALDAPFPSLTLWPMDKLAQTGHPRTIRSFVTRAGRLTDAQQRALRELWPTYGVDFDGKLLDLDALFGRCAARLVEIGFGNGDHLAALAASYPERDHLGIEVHRPGVGRALLAIHERALTNVRLVCHDAVTVLEHIPGRSLDEVLVLFPDPWPKKRHHKRRLIQPEFVAMLTARLKPGGVLRLATDWQPYAEQMLAVLDAEPQLRNLASDARFMTRMQRAPTRFERRGAALGHQIWDLAYRLR